MRKAILRYLTIASVAVASALASGSCTGDDIDAPGQQDDGFAINFYCSESNTRADGDPENAVSDYNENKIVSLAVALYPTSYGNDQNAVKFKVFKNLSSDISYTGKISLKEDEIASLFGNPAVSGTTCKVYAVANLPEATLTGLEGTKPTITALKNISITSEFNTKQTQSSFIMSGQGTATYTSNAGSISIKGEVPLYRTAAKITLNVKLPDKVHDPDDENVYWWPLPERGMQVLLNNGVKNSKVVSDGTVGSDGDYFNITTGNDNNWNFSDNSSAEYRWKQSYPFYTYPNKWENTPSETHRTSLTLIIPWQKGNASMVEGSTYETFYYTVPVTDTDLTEITSNYSYHIDLSVNMIGSRSPEYPEEIVGTYKAVDWMKEEMNVDVKDSRYLIVTPKVYEINNLEKFTLHFYSSHPVELEDITMSYDRFAYVNDTGSTEETVKQQVGTVVSFVASKEIIEKSKSGNYTMVKYTSDMDAPDTKTKQYTFSLEHELKIWTPVKDENATTILGQNTVELHGHKNLSDTTKTRNSIKKYLRSENPDNAYSPYTFRITLRHKDKKEFKETFTVIQYPTMYIQAVKNKREGPKDHLGNNYVNGTGTNTGGLGDIVNLNANEGNKNPNMYIINVTKLEDGSNYYIGDPRTLYTNNDLSTETGNYYNKRYPNLTTPTADGAPAGSWCRSANDLYDKQNRTLKYYYPTIESDDDNYKMMIAPKLRVASSFGAVYPINRDAARRRCATYQEVNCPAGRWRLPTYGEIAYIVNLSEKNIIPTLFSPGRTNGYWCAQGCYYIEDGKLKQYDNNNSNHAVRCVYDEWYWEKETDYTISPDENGHYTYTLGDMPKRNSQQN